MRLASPAAMAGAVMLAALSTACSTSEDEPTPSAGATVTVTEQSEPIEQPSADTDEMFDLANARMTNLSPHLQTAVCVEWDKQHADIRLLSRIIMPSVGNLTGQEIRQVTFNVLYANCDEDGNYVGD